MAAQATIERHVIRSLDDIHSHLELVAKEMKATERNYRERNYKVRWHSVKTFSGICDLGTEAGYSTNLEYTLILFPVDKPKEPTS